jgi:hypothetical protein
LGINIGHKNKFHALSHAIHEDIIVAHVSEHEIVMPDHDRHGIRVHHENIMIHETVMAIHDNVDTAYVDVMNKNKRKRRKKLKKPLIIMNLFPKLAQKMHI